MPKYVPLVVLGGGGHTQEMIEIVRAGPAFNSVSLVVSSSDELSQRLFVEEVGVKRWSMHRTGRPTGIGRSWSFIEMAWSVITAAYAVLMSRSDFLLCNGPGLCVPVVMAYRIINPFKPVIYIESMTRVSSISTTGRILQYVVSAFIVQKKELERKKYPVRTYQEIFQIKRDKEKNRKKIRNTAEN